MIRPEQIPDEVVEAAARAICRAEYGDELVWDAWIGAAEASIAAALTAWPGVSEIVAGINKGSIILPISTENSDE